MSSPKIDENHVRPQGLTLTKNIRASGYEKTEAFKRIVSSINARLDAGLEPVADPITYYVWAGRYYVLDGNRRVAAACVADECDCILGMQVDPPATDCARMIEQLVSNSMHEDLDPISKARTYRAILEADPSMTQKQLAEIDGKSTSYVSQHLTVLKRFGNDPDMLDRISSGEIQIAVAQDIASKITNEQVENHRDLVLTAATRGTQVASRKAVTILANTLSEVESIFDTIPTKQDPPQEPDIPKQEPVDETIMRLRSMADMIKKLVEKFKAEANEAGIGIESQLEDIKSVL